MITLTGLPFFARCFVAASSAVALAMSTYGITTLITIVPEVDEREFELSRVAISPY